MTKDRKERGVTMAPIYRKKSKLCVYLWLLTILRDFLPKVNNKSLLMSSIDNRPIESMTIY